MKTRIIITAFASLAFIISLLHSPAFAQDTEWFYYPSNQVYAVADDGDYFWAGGCGLVKINKSTGDITYFNSANSGLPSNEVRAIAIDKSGNKWIGTYGNGIAKYDGSDWTVYHTANSGLPFNYVNAISIDGNGNKWIGTNIGGLAKFDGADWTVYNTDNSGLPSNYVNAIAIDKSGNKWICTNRGLAKYNGADWTVYNTDNSGLPSNIIYAIAIDQSGNKWIGTYYGGLAKYGGSNWTVFNEDNSGLHHSIIRTIAIDSSGNKWMNSGGLTKFNGSDWTVYNTTNSGLPANSVKAIAIDSSGNKWIGTLGGGLAVFDYSITTGSITFSFCEGEEFDIDLPFTSICEFNEGNVFSAQLSDADGDFSNPVEIGTLSSDKPGTIEAVIQGAIPAGAGYRIRVVSSDPIKIGVDNGKNIIIFPLPPKPTITEKDDILTSSSPAGNQWYFNGELIQGATGETYDTKQVAGIYTVQFTDKNGCLSEISDEYDFVSGVEEELINSSIKFTPNPFSNSTTIEYALSEPANVRINIYNALGNKIMTLDEGFKDIGVHSAVFEAGNLPPGMYYYIMQIGERIESGKMVLVR